jgi:hypothetical protein
MLLFFSMNANGHYMLRADLYLVNFQCFRQAKLVFLSFRATTNSAWSVYIVILWFEASYPSLFLG